MAIPENQVPQNAQEMLKNMAAAFGLEIEIKSEAQDSGKAAKKRKPKKLPKAINEEDFAKILRQINPKCLTGCRNIAILESMYKAGLRVQETCDLTPADVNLETGMIYVQSGKGEKDRYLPMGACLIESLSKWDSIRPQQAERFFCTCQGRPLSQRYIREMLGRKSKEAGVFIQDGKKQKPVNPHALRHSCATNLLNKGMNIRKVQELLGHENLTSTMIYTHVSIKELDRDIKALG